MSNSSKISVIVAVYNTEELVEKCINSILNQSHQNLELLLINDGSTDSSGEICKKYSRIDPRVQYLEKSNGGQGSARNMALDIASGDYIAFVDSDDWINQDMYENMLSYLENNEVEIVQCSSIKVDDRGNIVEGPRYQIHKKYDRYEAMKIHIKGPDIVIDQVPWNKLYEKKLFEKVRFKESRIHEDSATIYKLIHNSSNILVIPDVYYNVLERSDSTTRKSYNNDKYEAITVFEEMEAFFKNQDDYSDLIKYAVASQISNVLYIVGEIYRQRMLNADELLEKCIAKANELKQRNIYKNSRQKILLSILLRSSKSYSVIHRIVYKISHLYHRNKFKFKLIKNLSR